MRENLHYQRERLEETYRSFHDFADQLSSTWWTVAAAAEKRLSKEEVPELLRNDKSGRHLQRLQIITTIHLPKLAPFVDRLIKLRDEASELVAPVLLFGEASDETAERLHGVEVRLGSLREDFDAAVRREARKLRGLRAWWRV